MTPIPETGSIPITMDPELTKCISDTTQTASLIFKTAKSALNNLKTYATVLYLHIQKQIVLLDIDAVNNQTNKMYADAEKVFNIAECLPLIGWISGSLRTLLGQMQAVGGIALTTLGELGVYMASENPQDAALKKKWELLSKIGIEMTVHGCFNTMRGTVAAVIGSYTFGAGNLLLLVPNMINQRNFGAFLQYGAMK